MNRWETVDYRCTNCGRITKITKDEERRLNENMYKIRPCKCGSETFQKVLDQQVTF